MKRLLIALFITMAVSVALAQAVLARSALDRFAPAPAAASNAPSALALAQATTAVTTTVTSPVTGTVSAETPGAATPPAGSPAVGPTVAAPVGTPPTESSGIPLVLVGGVLELIVIVGVLYYLYRQNP